MRARGRLASTQMRCREIGPLKSLAPFGPSATHSGGNDGWWLCFVMTAFLALLRAPPPLLHPTPTHCQPLDYCCRQALFSNSGPYYGRTIPASFPTSANKNRLTISFGIEMPSRLGNRSSRDHKYTPQVPIHKLQERHLAFPVAST